MQGLCKGCARAVLSLCRGLCESLRVRAYAVQEYIKKLFTQSQQSMRVRVHIGKEGSKGEVFTREYLERAYWPHKFPRKRPHWLLGLELDCYCEELRIAYEYNGTQHYAWPNPFHKLPSDWLRQVLRDREKAQLCIKHGVGLVYVID